ncbi:MAG: FemAB family PEP-CTERM system-associated protein [Desulfamplus sp.]|nr:FemAB family PEP-CTERM system-associated protein [Desulfamplus sp.]
MIIRQYTSKDKNAWDRYVLKHPFSTIFHLTAWKEVVEDSFHHKSFYLVCEDENSSRITGLLPLFEIKSLLFGHYLISNPFAELGGILADDDDVEAPLLNRAVVISKKLNCDYLELRNKKELPNLLTKSLYYNFQREISHDHDENLKAIPRKSRAMVRKGIKSELASEMGHHLFSEFYEMLSLNFHRLGTPVFSRAYLEKLLKKDDLKTNILVIRTKEQQTCAAVMTFFFKDQVVPYYAGSDNTMRHLGINDFMYWELMKHGADRGYRIFDYGRSKEGTGSFSFKKHWGFKPNPLAYQYNLVKIDQLPNLSPANPKYQKKIEMWRRLPLWATKIIGPFIARNLA